MAHRADGWLSTVAVGTLTGLTSPLAGRPFHLILRERSRKFVGRSYPVCPRGRREWPEVLRDHPAEPVRAKPDRAGPATSGQRKCGPVLDRTTPTLRTGPRRWKERSDLIPEIIGKTRPGHAKRKLKTPLGAILSGAPSAIAPASPWEARGEGPFGSGMAGDLRTTARSRFRQAPPLAVNAIRRTAFFARASAHYHMEDGYQHVEAFCRYRRSTRTRHRSCPGSDHRPGSRAHAGYAIDCWRSHQCTCHADQW